MLHLLKRVVGVQRHDGSGKQQTGQKFKGSDALDALGEGLTRRFLGALSTVRAGGGTVLLFRCVSIRGCFVCFRCHRRPSLGVCVRATGAHRAGGTRCLRRAGGGVCVRSRSTF